MYKKQVLNKNKIIIVFSWILGAMLFGCSDSDANENNNSGDKGFTYSDVITAYDSFNEYLFQDSRQVYRRDAGSGTSEIAVGWTQAMMFDMTINAYKLTGDKKYMDLMERHFEGCSNEFTFDWYDYSHWDLYDDMMWWVGSLARAYLLTKDDKYLKISEDGFYRVWNGKPQSEGGHPLDKGSFDPNSGGMYWDWKFGRTGKMACINYPTIIAAMELYKATNNSEYLEKAKTVYKWASENLFNPVTGAVADSKHDGNADAAWTMLVYNQATCMGSAAMLYLVTKDQTYLNHAKAAMDYIIAKKSTANKVLRPEGNPSQEELTDEKGIYNAILAQYIPILINDCGQTQYTEYIERSINLGWKNRDKERNLTNKFLERAPLSTSPLSSYTASGIPALMLTFPNVKDRK